ncbi:MAG: SpoIIE family protein phosphatase [Roseibium sp.]|uniref:PP2C family protein-serine/threonine phosphatase n=1 Tax=Roseibium sp. TaxID=1936156 RepID=UPI001B164BC2|nr:SpoIIE family protein phosphatase [Roseibium sp.]MBO6931049.1 SpoIIE family protein phosphatase [Roseibium sp.]
MPQNTRRVDRFWLSLIERPFVFLVLVLLGLAMLPVAVWLDLRAISDVSLKSQAIDLDQAISKIRTYYAQNVVSRVLNAPGDVSPTHEYHETPGGIPIPATLSIELGEVIGGEARNLEYRFVSDLPFQGRASHDLSAFETSALTEFRESRDPEDVAIGYEGSIFDRKIQIASPVVLGEACVACHNSHPESLKQNWTAGDIKGIQAITISQPIAANLWSFKFLLLYFAGAGLIGAAVTGLQWHQATRFHKMNLTLEAANGQIASLNEQLTSENLRLGAEIEVARQIQMMVLPTKDELGGIHQLEIAAFMEPADEVGGDYYDVLQLDGRVKIGIGDVTGHGLESGVLMLMVQSVAVALQEQGLSNPRQFLVTLNSAICRNIKRTRTDKHLTLSFLDFEHDKLTLSGQHEELIILRRDGGCEIVDTVDLGFPIGLDEDIEPFIEMKVLPFEAGDLIILYTDGVTEAESPAGQLFGMDRLVDSALRHQTPNAARVLEGILADLKAHIGTQTVHDDITLLVVRHT